MIKLNLGCGNKLYPASEGWVNIDVIEPPQGVTLMGYVEEDLKGFAEGVTLYLQSHLEDLQHVADGCVDEIHGYHIIEHFYRSQVQDVLKEWKRVLKPDGLIVLEQPDILKCALNIIAGVMHNSVPTSHNLGVLGFFGDGTPEEPYMGHKWGWYPATLVEQLELAGFTNIVSKEAKTHMGPARDFRIEGNKCDTIFTPEG